MVIHGCQPEAAVMLLGHAVTTALLATNGLHVPDY